MPVLSRGPKGRGSSVVVSERGGEPEAYAARLDPLGGLAHGAKHHVELCDMLDELGARAGLVRAVEGDDVGIEIADPLDPENTGPGIGEAHRHLVVAIEPGLEILDVEDQPLVRPFGRALLADRLLLHLGGKGRGFGRVRLAGLGVGRAAAAIVAFSGHLEPRLACQSHAPSSRLVRLARPECQRLRQCAMASTRARLYSPAPISRRKSVVKHSVAVCGSARNASSRSSAETWFSMSCAARNGRPVNGSPCPGRASWVSVRWGRSARWLVSQSATGSASGSVA